MQRNTGLNPLTFDSCEVISLMIKHANNELPPAIHQKVSDLINNCEDCQKLYEEVHDFFNESETLLFEITHEEEIESSRRQLKQLIKSKGRASLTKSDEADHRELLDVPDDGCLCCGS